VSCPVAGSYLRPSVKKNVFGAYFHAVLEDIVLYETDAAEFVVPTPFARRPG
jgi:hypothetical protein